MEEKKRVLSILTRNTAGVLSRVAGLFSRRGYNIDSLTVGVTADNRFSRMTVGVTCSESILKQVVNQVSKLEDVLHIKVLIDDSSVCRELIFLKIAVTAEQRQSVIAVANIFRAKIVDVAKESLVIELTGNQNKLEAFIKLLSDYEILELARSGIIGLSRGANDVINFDD